MPYRLFHNDENWREMSNMQYDILCTLNRTVHLAMRSFICACILNTGLETNQSAHLMFAMGSKKCNPE